MIVTKILEAKSNADIVTLPPDASVREAIKLLSDKKIGTIVVSKDGKSLDGILSERDIVRVLGRKGESCLAEPVAALMTAKLVTCHPTDTADAVLGQMTQGRFRHMPVVADDGATIGLISIGDVVKARLSELAMEKDALEGMIMGH